MPQNDPDERLVYLACQHIFRGSNAQLRKRKSVMSVIQRNKSALTDILREHSIDRTCNVAKRLLEDQVFYSTLNAKVRFPELFDVSPTQSAEREASEAEAAREEANVVREISARDASASKVAIIPKAPSDRQEDEKIKSDGKDSVINKTIPSLYPIYIHYRSQHLITTAVQGILEESCYEFAQQHFPEILVRNGWDCAEAVELTEWTKILPSHSAQLTLATKKSLLEIFELLRELRHSAVHRLRKTASGIERLVENAQLFLEILNDTCRSEKVTFLRRELSLAIEELKRNKDLLEGKMRAELEDIQARRAHLDMLEQAAKATMVNSDIRCLNDIDDVIGKIIQDLLQNGVRRAESLREGRIDDSELSDAEAEILDAVAASNCSVD
ncbi:unnamed protein product [Penicillium pancosmium]